MLKFSISNKVTYIISDIDSISDMVTCMLCDSKILFSNYPLYLANFPLTTPEIQYFLTLIVLFLN